jgi:phage terminase small subunit
MTGKQEKFLAEYLKDFNGTAAARRLGYTEGSARTTAYRFLRSPAVREALARELTKPSPARVIAELQAVAFAEGSDENGSATKLASKLRALELLGKHLGLFDPSAQTPPEPVTIIEDISPTGAELKVEN